MTMLLDPRPLEDPAYWSPMEYASFYDFCEQVSDQIDRQYGCDFTAQEVKKSYYAQREYDLGTNHLEVAEMIYEYEIIGED